MTRRELVNACASRDRGVLKSVIAEALADRSIRYIENRLVYLYRKDQDR